jgi:phosphatidylserine synthase
MFSPMRRSILYLAAVLFVIADLLRYGRGQMATMKGVVLLPEGTTGVLLRGPPTPMNARLIYTRFPESMHISIESYACQFSFGPEATL